jgi:hypothetical protein
VVLRGDCVVALPRRGTKTASAVAFELASGRELDIATLAGAGGRGSGDGLRLDYLSSPVGRGPSQLRLFAGSASEPWRTIELPDAVSAVAEAPFGWYVGCRDGFLYGLERSGELAWRWQTPGADAFRPSAPGEVYFRPSPYRLASNGHSALVAWLDRLWSVGPDGMTEWGLRMQDLNEPQVIEVRLRGRQTTAAAALGVSAQASPLEVKRAYREAVKNTHPDLHPDDASAAERFRGVQQAYESLTGRSAAGGNGALAGVIRFSFPSAQSPFSTSLMKIGWSAAATGGSFDSAARGGWSRDCGSGAVPSSTCLIAHKWWLRSALIPSPGTRRRTSGSSTRPLPSGCRTSTRGPTTWSAATATTCSPTDRAVVTLG